MAVPFFSVIIPNYNHAAFLIQRIDSVLRQTFSDFEVIILDDCSTDDSKEIIESYRKHPKVNTIVYNTHNSGSPFIQWKRGIESAQGKWIWIAESDDWAEANFLETAANSIRQYPEIGMYYSDAKLIDKQGNFIHRASDFKNKLFNNRKWSQDYLAKGTEEINEALKFYCSINNTSTFIFKREIGENIKEELIQYKYIGDWFFYIKACLQTTIYFNHQALVSYRSHERNFINRQNPIHKIKKEYFQLLRFLLQQQEVTEKKKLVNYFALVYLSFGWKEENFWRGMLLFKNYFKQDFWLASIVLRKTLWYKLTQRKTLANSSDWIYKAKRIVQINSII